MKAGHLEYFRPHGFSRHELAVVLWRPFYLVYGLFVSGDLAGYCILKLFPGRIVFRGRLVAEEWVGKGIGRYLSNYIDWQCTMLNVRSRSTISRRNRASLKSHAREGDYQILGELPGDYMLIEFNNVDSREAPILRIEM
jgi:GNAT superfamily N-acetyltransferase